MKSQLRLYMYVLLLLLAIIRFTSSQRQPSLYYGIRLSLLPGDDSARGLQFTWNTRISMKNPCVQVSSNEPSSIKWKWHGRFKPFKKQYQAEGLYASEGYFIICGGTSQPFTEPSTNQTAAFIHRVTLTDSIHAFKYRVGSSVDGWSDWIDFAHCPTSSSGTNLLLVGDMGLNNAKTLPDIQKDLENRETCYSALLHIGDIAYDLASLKGHRGISYLTKMQATTSRTPYMVSPGNHEAAFNFTHYRSFFTMPDWAASESLFYSYNIGLVHVVSINSEVFFWPDHFQQEHMHRMYEWLENDLIQTNSQQSQTPWILVIGHRPMYCGLLNDYTGRCSLEQEAVRQGIPSVCPRNNPQWCHPIHHNASSKSTTERWPIEELLYRYNVDIYVSGHVHAYLRFAPVYNYTVLNGQGSHFGLYKNPRAPIHVVSGAGGNSEMHDGPQPPPSGSCYSEKTPWCMYQSGFAPQVGVQSYDFSYSRIHAVNATHLHWMQYSSYEGKVIDDWWVEKSSSREVYEAPFGLKHVDN